MDMMEQLNLKEREIKRIVRAKTKAMKIVAKACGWNPEKATGILAYMYVKVASIGMNKEDATEVIRYAFETLEEAKEKERVREEWRRVYGENGNGSGRN